MSSCDSSCDSCSDSCSGCSGCYASDGGIRSSGESSIVSSDSSNTVGELAHHEMEPGDTIDKYTVLDKLGSGYFGIVWHAKEQEAAGESNTVAIKVSRADPTYTEMYEHEIALMESIPPHPNVLELLDSFVFSGSHEGEHYALVLPFVDGSDLFTHMRNEVRRGEFLDPTLAQRFSRQLFHGLAHLARADVIHSDLKIENLLISADLQTLKIADFGTALHRGGRLRLYGHTAPYRSPEIILGRRFADITPAADVWSAALIVYELHCVRGYTLLDVEHEDASGDSLDDDDAFELDHMHLRKMIGLFGPFGKRSVVNVRDHFTSRGVLRTAEKARNGERGGSKAATTTKERKREREGEGEGEQRRRDCARAQKGSADPPLLDNFVRYGSGRELGQRLCAFVLPMLRYAPQKRATAEGALQHEFFEAFAGQEFSSERERERRGDVDIGEEAAPNRTPQENGDAKEAGGGSVCGGGHVS